jgi:hypothetical protein
MISKLAFCTSITAAALAAAVAITVPTHAQSAPVSPDRCLNNVNGVATQTYPRSCIFVNTTGNGTSGQPSIHRATIANGRQDNANTFSSNGGSAMTSWTNEG